MLSLQNFVCMKKYFKYSLPNAISYKDLYLYSMVTIDALSDATIKI